ncbi:glycosyltransferase family 4 protein [bacterium]|nr:glycosyltransferase family 4 protein [bacterium]
MRIAWLMPNLHITGGARAVVELSNRLIKRNHEIFILIPSGRYKLPINVSAQVIECGIKVRNPILAVLTGMLPMLNRVPKVDVIISCMPPYALMGRYISNLRLIPSINYLLNDDVHFFDDGSFIRSRLLLQIYRFLARWSVRGKVNFANSHWTAVQAVSEGGTRPTAIIQQGYNPKVFFPLKTSVEKDRRVTLITVGRKARWKGFSDLIKSLNLVDRIRYPFKLKVISQEITDCPAAKFPLSFHKPKSDDELADLYRSGQVYVHSSWFEGFGMPPLEAQACGLAVISTNCGGVREYLVDGDNALLVPPREPVTMARAVEKIINDRKLLIRLSIRGLETCINFNFENVTDHFEKALIDLHEKYNRCQTLKYL